MKKKHWLQMPNHTNMENDLNQFIKHVVRANGNCDPIELAIEIALNKIPAGLLWAIRHDNPPKVIISDMKAVDYEIN